MAVFGGLSLTNKGLVLQGKAQAGAQLNYTRIAVGDGSLSGQSIPAMNSLISQKKNLPITRLRTQPPNKAIVGAVLKNADVTTGFFWREVGLFAQDPDAGEILYAYANAGVTADYIPPGGGSDVIEKQFDCVVVVGTASNISAVIDDSLVFALKSELDAVAAVKVDIVSGKGLSTNDFSDAEKNKLADITSGAGGPGSATDTVIGNRTIIETTAPADTGTITGLFSGIANMIKQITGGATWRTAPGMTIAAIKTILDSAVSAATASTLIKRDSAGRAKVAAPSAADDIAIKSTVDDAKTAAIAASIPLAQKGVAGGVAALDAKRNMLAEGILLPGYSLSRYTFSTVDGVANQKMDFYFPFEGVSGYIEVEVSGTWAFGQAQGKLVKRMNIVGNSGGGIDSQTSEYTDVTGPVQDSVVISDLKADTPNSRFVITLEMLNSQGNTFSVLIRRHSPFGVTPLTMGTVYTGAATTLPKAVQTIPDNTITQSGYLIQKHKMTSNDGRVINLPTGYDLDGLLETGFYDGVGLFHAPNGSDNWWYINCFNHSGDPAGYVHQVATALVGTASSPVTYERVRQGYTWGNWMLSVGNGIFKIKGLVQSDLNDYVEPGMYQIFGATGLPNAPALSAPWAIMNVFQGSNGYLVQEVTQTTAPYTKFYRGRIETDWGTWQKVLTAGSVSGIGDIGTYIVNADTLYDNGFYNVPATWTGSPFAGEDGANQGYINHLSWNNGSTYAYQLFMPINAQDRTQMGLRYRRKINNVWDTKWTPIYGAENDFNLMIVRDLPSINLNDAEMTGIYLLGANSIYTNASGLDWCIMKVYKNGAGYIEQEVSGVSGSGKKFRTRTEFGTWTSWIRVLTDADSASFAPAVHEHSRLVATTTVRNIRPNATGHGQLSPYFVSRSGLNGAVSTDYSDMLVLNTYDDGSGGSVNALVFDKSTFQIFHYQAPQTAPAWGTPKTLAYTEDIVQGTHTYAVTTGTGTGYAANFNPAVAALTPGLRLTIKAHAASAGPITLTVNGLEARPIKKPNGNNPPLALGGVYTVVYDGSVFTLQGEGGEYGTAGAAQVLAGYTVGREDGVINGTIPVITVGADPAQGVGKWGDGALAVYPSEGYRKGGAGAGEIKVSQAQLKSVNAYLAPEYIKTGAEIFGVVGTMNEYTRFDGNSSTLSLAPGVTNGWTLPTLNPLHALFITDPSGNIMYCAAYRSQSGAYAILNSNNLVLTLTVNGTSSSCTVKNNNSFTSVIMNVVIGPR